MFFTEEPYRSPILSPKSDLQSLYGKFTDSVNLSPTAYWWLAFSSDLVVGCVSLVRMHLLYQSSELCQALFETFLNFFSLSLIFFYWFGRSVLFLACFCFVPPVWWRQTHYTHVLHYCQALFEKFLKKVFRKILDHWWWIKKSRIYFSCPFITYEITCIYRCQGQSTHHFSQSM